MSDTSDPNISSDPTVAQPPTAPPAWEPPPPPSWDTPPAPPADPTQAGWGPPPADPAQAGWSPPPADPTQTAWGPPPADPAPAAWGAPPQPAQQWAPPPYPPAGAYPSAAPGYPGYAPGAVDPRKSKMAAGLLGILLGTFGVHNFYLGYTGKAIAQLLITVLSCGVLAIVSSIWGIVEGVMILTGNIATDANGVPLKD